MKILENDLSINEQHAMFIKKRMRNVQKLKDINISFGKFSNVLLVWKILEIVEEHIKEEKVINITERTEKDTNFSYK